ncbi:MAG: hypothetical protein IJX39_06755 [Clostridia bacterium]|nr:hypothetical protein [Clostridia bacterium]
MEYKTYGHYSADGKEYIITERKTPRHWYNYFFNDSFNSFTSQVGYGEGFAQNRLGKRLKLITDRSVYIVDKANKTWHTANGLPMSAAFDRYECHHGLGYTTYVTEKSGIEAKYTIFVPVKGDCEQWIVELTNHRVSAADLGVIAWASTDVDGAYEPQGYTSMEGHWDAAANAIIHRVSSHIAEKNGIVYPYMMCDAPVSGFDCRKNAFIGVYGNKETPEALTAGLGCTDSDCVVEKLCFALETACNLGAGESKTVCFQIGHVVKRDEVASMHEKLDKGAAKAALETVIATRAAECRGVEIKTPDEMLNKAFNSFYKYSADMGSIWARVRHNGYRDMAGDTEGFATFNPKGAWERYKRILEFQYSSGYAPRTIKDGKIQDNNFADCAVWLFAAAHTIVMELGELDLLREEVAFNDGTTATVFEHLRRAATYLYNFQGMHGLIKIWGGDWNDGMNWAGLEGKGVSIWLSIAWYRGNKMFIELAEQLGETGIAKKHTEMGDEMRKRIEKFGFDKDHYLAAINDDGMPIGAWDSPATKMWINPQTWAVMAGLAPKEKLLKVMEAVDNYLETPYGTLINRPAFTERYTKVGSFTRQPAGTLLNESVYLQPMAWKITADAILGRREQMQASLYKLLPWNHTYAETQGEPYILYNFYATDKTGYRAGIPGQSWRTATAHCLIRTVVRYLYGLVPTLEGLRLEPCLPPDWQECSITKEFRGATYRITYRQKGTDGMKITVDGMEIKGDLLPFEKGKAYTVEVLC